MKNLRILLLLFLLPMLFNCEKNTTSLESKPIKKLTFKFEAKVDNINGAIPFQMQIGDTIIGSFSFDPNIEGINTQYDYSKIYPQTSVNGEVSFTINDVVFIANIDSFPQYEIEIQNNGGFPNECDEFIWCAGFPDIEQAFGQDNIQTWFRLIDYSGNSFQNLDMPSDLELSKFEYKRMWVVASKYNELDIDDWHFEATITSLNLETVIYRNN